MDARTKHETFLDSGILKKIQSVKNDDSLINAANGTAIIKQKSYFDFQYELLHDKYKNLVDRIYANELTVLPNRRKFEVLMNKALLKDMNGILVLVDIKNFNQINFHHGITFGDQLIEKIGTCFQRNVSDESIIGYLGGNTFSFYYLRCDSHEELLLEIGKVLKTISNDFADKLYLKATTVAIPVNIMRGCFEDYYKLADHLLKRIKKEDKELLYFDHRQYAEEITRRKLVDYVNESVEKKKYTMVYQEKIDSTTGKVVGLEALARLKKNNVFISPNVFIPILEQSGAIVDFGANVLEMVFNDMNTIDEKYSDSSITVSINISPSQLKNDNFVNQIRELIDTYKIDMTRIEFEITENVFIDNFTGCNELIVQLKELGVKFAIDDFGTGYSSLKYISILPIDTLKIDKSFIDIISEEKDKAVVKAIIDVAKASKLNIVAEGVETIRQVEILSDLGCTIIQGYVYSHPQRLNEVDII